MSEHETAQTVDLPSATRPDRARRWSVLEAGRRNADRMVVGGRVSEGPFVALVWFVGRGSMRSIQVVAGRWSLAFGSSA
jgi:hypothetical protein